jgi:hypothetical protein
MVRALGLRRSASLLNNPSRTSKQWLRPQERTAIGAVYASLIEHDPQGVTPVVDLN